MIYLKDVEDKHRNFISSNLYFADYLTKAVNSRNPGLTFFLKRNVWNFEGHFQQRDRNEHILKPGAISHIIESNM